MALSQNNRTKSLYVFIPSILTLLIVTLFSFMGVLEKGEMILYDYFTRLRCNKIKKIDEISIIAIDDNSINYMKNEKGVNWPWPRDIYYPLLKFMEYGGAKAVVFDVDFFDRRDEDNQDEVFSDALKLNHNTFLTAKLKEIEDFNKRSDAETKNDIKKNSSYTIENDDRIKFQNYDHIQYPPKIFVDSVKGFGTTNITFDKDGAVRKYQLFNYYKNIAIPSLSLKVFALLNGINNFTLKNDFLYFDDKRVSLFGGEMYIRWYGHGLQSTLDNKDGVFKYYPFYYVEEAGIDLITGKKPRLKVDEFENKIVFIGGTAPNLFDFKKTPISYRSKMDPGVEVHASALANFSRSDFLRRFSALSLPNLIAFFLTAILIPLLLLLSRSMVKSTLFAIFYFVILSLVYFFSFVKFNLYLDMIHIIITFTLSFFGTLSYSYISERRSKDTIKKMFRYYVDPSILEKLLENPENIKIGGERREITILFSDIRGFTTISESLSPEALIEYLNLYLGEMSNIIVKNRGCIDKFIGDAIMAFFGAPVYFSDHPLLACKAAIESQQRLVALKSEYEKRGWMSPYARIGINTGIATVGNVGSDLTKEKRYNYTAIGDSVNLSSRLEGTNKIFGTRIMIGENTFERVKDGVVTRFIDRVRVVGKREPVKIYELISVKNECPTIYERVLPLYCDAIIKYERRDWDSAIKLFNDVLKVENNDGPSLEYLKRLQRFKQNPPQDDWDGVYEMRTK